MTTRTSRLALPRVVPLVVLVLVTSGCVGPAPGPTGAVATSSPISPTTGAPPTPTASPLPAVRPTTPPTQALIDFLLERVAADPTDADAQTELGYAILQRIRETADPSLYAAAEQAFEAARLLRPEDPGPLIGLGGLQLGRHEFAAALQTGTEALDLDPASAGAGAIVVDALIELGRYEEGFVGVEDLVAMSADLPSLARLSYARELQGDLTGALDAMERAAGAGGLAAENTAFALAIVGQLQRRTGHPAAARGAYEQALTLVPDHAPSLAGLGRLAVGDGDLRAAAGYFERAAAIVPLAEYVIALGDTLAAAGDASAAQHEYDLARAEIELFEASGVAVDLEFSLFEADHGDPARALILAESAHAAAPTVGAADALAWALHRNGRDDEAWKRAQEALRLGSREPLFHYHAGAIAAARGDPATARNHLTSALTIDPGFSATGAVDARAILAGLPAAS